MIETFAEWLKDNSSYSPASKSDVISRLKRANRYLELPNTADMNYLYNLQQMPEYRGLSVSVRSQIKKSVLMYFDYLRISN